MSEPRADTPPPVYFELHIAPLMRELDRRHMLAFSGIDLLDYATVVRLNDSIHDHLVDQNDPMPTRSTGGPWPPEWIRLFERWGEQKFARLERAAGTYKAKRESSSVLVTATGNVPGPGYVVWLGAVVPPGGLTDLALYQRPPDAAAGIAVAAPFSAKERFLDPAGKITSFTIEDRNGTQTVPVT